MKKITLIWAMAFLCWPLFAHSEIVVTGYRTVKYAISGSVTSVDKNTIPISEIQVADPVSGFFTFDTATADEVPSEPLVGRYQSDHFQININGIAYESKNNTIEVTNDAVLIPNSPKMDAFEVVSSVRNVSGPDLSGLPIAQADIVIVDTTANTFSDDALPSNLSIGNFDITSEDPYGTTGGRLIFHSLYTGGFGEVRFAITSITATPIADDDQDGGYFLTDELWARAELQVPGSPVPLNWKEVGSDTTPSGARVVSGYFFAHPDNFAYGSLFNPEAFVKVYIDPSGWANIAVTHVTVDDVVFFSAHNYDGTADQSGTATLENRNLEQQYVDVGLQ